MIPRTFKAVADPFLLPSITLASIPKLTNFKAGRDFFSKGVLDGNKELDRIWVAPKQTIDSFEQLFPEIVQSRKITKISEQDFSRWEEGSNKIELVLEKNDSVNEDEKIELLSVGGPSALAASILYKIRHPQKQVVYAVTNRYDSNHDGSAYYYHERDALPVYSNELNGGPYCVYIDLKKRIMGGKKLLETATQHRQHVKISLNWTNIKLSYLFNIFIPNVWHMLGDIYFKKPKNSLMRQLMESATRTPEIIASVAKNTGMPMEEMFINAEERAIHVTFKGEDHEVEHFTWLNTYVNFPFYVKDFGKAFGTQVGTVLVFPRDGLISPWIFEKLTKQLQEGNGECRKQFQVLKIICNEESGKQGKIRASKVVWKNLNTLKTHITAMDNLLFSFGPSGTIHAKVPDYSLMNHLVDVLRNKQGPAYQPKLAFWIRHLVNKSKSLLLDNRIFKEFMQASGSSSVIVIGVDPLKSTQARLEVFQKFLGGTNQHWTLIAHRDVVVDGKVYKYFAIQMTGGGNFPSRHTRPDYLVNLLRSSELMYDLNRDDVIGYDVVQSRGCGRAVSAKNSVAFSRVGTNCVGSYALGGVGMTTMFPNAELMVQLLEDLQGAGQGKLNDGLIGNSQFQQKLYGKQNVLAGIDYSRLVDEDNIAARLLGVDSSLSRIEKVVMFGIVCVLTSAVQIYALLSSKKQIANKQTRKLGQYPSPQSTTQQPKKKNEETP